MKKRKKIRNVILSLVSIVLFANCGRGVRGVAPSKAEIYSDLALMTLEMCEAEAKLGRDCSKDTE